MPIRIPNNLPARGVLEGENIFIMSESRAESQQIRPLRIGLLNLMPTKITTETQLSRLLGNTPLQVELFLIQVSSHQPKNTPQEHMIAFYRNFEEKEDVILLMIDFLRAEYERELPGVPPEQAAHFHFSFLSRHMDFLILLETAGQTPLLTGRFSELQPRVMPRWSADDRENTYRTAVVVAGTEAVIRLWARQGFRETPEELERLYRYAMGAPAPEKSDRIEVNML